MRSIAIIAFLALLIMPCIAVPDSVTTGPYNVTFDIGIPKEVYKVDIVDPKTTETSSGDVKTEYNIKLANKTGIFRRALITLASYETEQVIPTQEELVQILRSLGKNNSSDVKVAGGKIGGFEGAVSSEKLTVNGITFDFYFVMFYPSSEFNVMIGSGYPWEEGTRQLFETIHIEKINTTL